MLLDKHDRLRLIGFSVPIRPGADAQAAAQLPDADAEWHAGGQGGASCATRTRTSPTCGARRVTARDAQRRARSAPPTPPNARALPPSSTGRAGGVAAAGRGTECPAADAGVTPSDAAPIAARAAGGGGDRKRPTLARRRRPHRWPLHLSATLQPGPPMAAPAAGGAAGVGAAPREQRRHDATTADASVPAAPANRVVDRPLAPLGRHAPCERCVAADAAGAALCRSRLRAIPRVARAAALRAAAALDHLRGAPVARSTLHPPRQPLPLPRPPAQ